MITQKFDQDHGPPAIDKIVRAAIEYAKLGWCVIPVYGLREDGKTCECGRSSACRSPGKHPRFDDWQANASTDEATIAAWFERWPHSNVGVQFGPASGIIDIEYDSDEGKATADQLFGDCLTPTFRSGRSIHRLFRWMADLPARAVVKIAGLELRIGGGGKAAQSVFPPSRHYSGVRYAWLPGLSPADVSVADVPQSVLALLVNDAPGKSTGRSPNGGPVDWDLVQAALVYLPSDDYGAWLTVGMAIHGEDPSAKGLEVWETWSRTSTKFQVGECARRWATFNGAGNGSRVTLGTIFKRAEQAGWNRPTKATATLKSATAIKYQDFPTRLLPKPVAEFVFEAARAIGCDPCMVALPIISALAAAIGNTRRIALKNSWTEPSTIWTAVVAESGDLKSPALDAALAPLRARQSKAFEQFEAERQQYESDLLDYRVALDEWKKSGRKQGNPQPDPPDEPIAWRVIVSDTTVEALALILEGQQRGVIMVRDELAGWFGSFDQYKGGKGGDTAHWLEMQRAGLLIVDRKTGDKRTIYVPRASVCVTGGIQPAILAAALGREHFQNGLAARILLAMPPRRRKSWTDRVVPECLTDAMVRLFDDLLDLKFDVDPEDQPRPFVIPLSESGLAAWVTFYNAHAIEQTQLVGDILAAWSKLEGYAARLALLVHCIRCVTGDATIDPGRVDAASIEAGVGLARWFGNEAKRIYARLAGADNEEALVSFIKAQGGEVTARDAMRAGPCFKTSEEAEEKLNELVDRKRAVREVVETGRRPKIVWRLVQPETPKSTAPADTTIENPEENRIVSVSVTDKRGNFTDSGDQWGEL